MAPPIAAATEEGSKQEPTRGVVESREVEPVRSPSEALADATQLLANETTWYEMFGLQWEGDADKTVGSEGVANVVALNVEEGIIDALLETVLARMFAAFEGLFNTFKGVTKHREVALDLMCYCVGIAKYLLSVVNTKGLSPLPVMALGEFKAAMDDTNTLVHDLGLGEDEAVRAACVKQKQSLERLLIVVCGNGIVPEHHRESNSAIESTSEQRRKLTFVSHAGEEKEFVRSLLNAIEDANVAAFFDDDMALGTPSVDEMETRAAEADQAIVVLSRSFLTKE